MRIITIVGARPQFIKIAPMVRVCRQEGISHQLVHTGQHYDYEMSKIFFDELGLPAPDYHLEVGSGPHGEQTGEALQRVEGVLLREQPDWVLVYGDTNSTLAGALAAAKLHIPVAHIEAGLRSYNRHMPEELNRILTDHLATLLCCPTETAVANLRAEGFGHIAHAGRLLTDQEAENLAGLNPNGAPLVVNTGDVMYDAYLQGQEIASRRSKIVERLGLAPRGFFLATVHRAENTDDSGALARILEAFMELSRRYPVIWPLHPRTRRTLADKGLAARLDEAPGVKLLAPVGYFDMLLLERHAAVILTDSGGVQKEAWFAGTPCVTLRAETEWVETVAAGLNILAGTDPESIIAAALQPRKRRLESQPYGTGDAAGKILKGISGMARILQR